EKLEDFFSKLQKADGADFFAKIPPSEASKWSSLVNEALQLQCQTHFGLNIQAPVPSMILNLVKCLEITQKLAHKEGAFSGYALDMSPYKEMLKDPYLDLGGLGPKIMETIENIEGASQTHLRMTTVNPGDMSLAEKGFYKQFIKDHPHLKIPEDK